MAEKSHAAKLGAAVARYEEGVVALRKARDCAIYDAHEAGWTYQKIADHCNMSIDNVRRLVREWRIREEPYR